VKKHILGPVGVRGRNSDNTFIKQRIGWKPTTKLIDGIQETYKWINAQLRNQNA
jgi:nucleoside-diphosphate-sugar epimerase